MYLPELLSGILLRRYKRFIAEFELNDKTTKLAYCPNTGSMLGCSQPGSEIYLSHHPDPKRKYKYTWQLTRIQNTLVGVNPLLANKIVAEALKNGKISLLKKYVNFRPEVNIGNKVRIDFCLSSPDNPPCYLEVKSCTLVRNAMASFPDAISNRGQKHLKELIKLAQAGYSAAILYLIQRDDGKCFQTADDIDPEYGKLCRQAKEKGVHILAYTAKIDLQQIVLKDPLPLCSGEGNN